MSKFLSNQLEPYNELTRKITLYTQKERSLKLAGAH